MIAVAISSAVVVLLGALGAAFLMRNQINSQDIELKQRH